MSAKVIGYKIGSESVRLLAKSLNTVRLRPDGNYKYNPDDLIINLGLSSKPNWDNANVAWMNKPENVALAVCKKKTFLKLKQHNVAIPEFTEDKNIAIGWINNGDRVACRAILNGHSAQGLTIAHNVNELPNNTKLYVKYFSKKTEYRVHVIRDKQGLKVFDFIQKKAKSDIPNEQIDYEIRNHGQWIFARENVKLPKCVIDESIKAGDALGLDLYSADVCYSEKSKKCVVLELNSARSLRGPTTLEKYTNAIKKILNDEIVDGLNDKKKEVEIVNTPVIESNPVPVVVVPKVNPVPAPIQEVVAAIPIVAQNLVKVNEKDYNLAGVTNINIKQIGNKTRITGNINGVNHSVKILEIQDGVELFWWGNLD